MATPLPDLLGLGNSFLMLTVGIPDPQALPSSSGCDFLTVFLHRLVLIKENYKENHTLSFFVH